MEWPEKGEAREGRGGHSTAAAVVLALMLAVLGFLVARDHIWVWHAEESDREIVSAVAPVPLYITHTHHAHQASQGTGRGR